MGALIPVLTQAAIGTAVGIASNQVSRSQSQRSQEQSLEQLKAQQRLQEQQLAQDAALERQKIATDSKQDAEERQSALKRAVARQRASFGAQGISTGQGSSQAVLLGLFEETEDEKRRRDALDQIRLTSIDQDLGQRSSINVLQRTQLAERNDLANAARKQDFGFDVLSSAAKLF